MTSVPEAISSTTCRFGLDGSAIQCNGYQSPSASAALRIARRIKSQGIPARSSRHSDRAASASVPKVHSTEISSRRSSIVELASQAGQLKNASTDRCPMNSHSVIREFFNGRQIFKSRIRSLEPIPVCRLADPSADGGIQSIIYQTPPTAARPSAGSFREFRYRKPGADGPHHRSGRWKYRPGKGLCRPGPCFLVNKTPPDLIQRCRGKKDVGFLCRFRIHIIHHNQQIETIQRLFKSLSIRKIARTDRFQPEPAL